MNEIQPEPVSWLWEPYIPRGKITILQGDGGMGKTTISLAIAAAVANGEALPNDFSNAPAEVIFQTAEDGLADTIRSRLEQFGADCSHINVIDESEQSLSLSDGRIEQAIIKTNAKLLIIDPIQAYLGGADLNNARGMRPLMKSLGAAAERTGCAVVIIGHLNKGRTQSQYRGLGSIDIYAAARSVLTVGKMSEDMRVLVHNKSNLSPKGVPIAFSFDSACGFTWHSEYDDINVDEVMNGTGQSKSENQFAKARRLIETALRDGTVLAVDMERMADEHGISIKTFYRAKSALGVNSVKHNNQWYWGMPEIIVTEFREDSQHGQDGHLSMLSPLTISNENQMEVI